jgi:drug/metabolite transporter (DMT)-like permease
MSVVWGLPYLFIKVAVRHMTPAVVVEGRILIGVVLLLPLAFRQGQIRPLLRAWRPLVVYSIAEMAIPWFFLTDAEQRLPSSLSGLLVATVPLIAVTLAALTGQRDGMNSRSVAGLLVGLVGVGLLLGFDVSGGDAGSVVEVLVVAVCYATGPLVAARYLADQSGLALAAVSQVLVVLGYLPVAIIELPSRTPPATSIASVVALGVVCTALAFVAFFELIKEVGSTRATVITYLNPVVAVILGVTLLGEAFTLTTAAGFGLILAGSWGATRSGRTIVSKAKYSTSNAGERG